MFAISNVAEFLIVFFTESYLIVLIIDYGGITCLTYGIYMLARKYPKLSSGLKVSFLFCLLLLTSLIISIGIDITQVLNNYFLIILLEIQFGIITLITAYYLTLWLDIIFSFNKTKSYYYYGLLYWFGTIIGEAGLIISDYSTNSGFSIFMVGVILTLAAFIVEIVAGFKIYTRVNDLLIGKTGQIVYQQPYTNSYNQPTIPFSNQNPYYGPNQGSYQIPNKISDQNLEVESAIKFCGYCGSKISSKFKFCQLCGSKIE